MYEMKAVIQPGLIEHSINSEKFDSYMKSIARMKNSATWINCRDHIDGLIRYDPRHVNVPADMACRYAPGTYAWLEDSCCNPERAISVEPCIPRREDNLVMAVPTEVDENQADRCGYVSEQEKSLVLSIVRNKITAEECVQDPAGTGVSKIPFEPILTSMVTNCDQKYGFNGQPPACTSDDDCVEECIVSLGQCKVPFSDRMRYTFSCWQETMLNGMENSLREVLEKEIPSESTLPIPTLLERIASTERCIGPTSWSYQPENQEECLNPPPLVCTDENGNSTKNCPTQDDVDPNKLGYSTNVTALQEIVKQVVTNIRSKAISDVLQCKYYMLYENYQSLACEKSQHLTDVSCISDQSVWPIVTLVNPKEDETTFDLSRCSITFEQGDPGAFVEHVLAVDPKTLFESLPTQDEDSVTIGSVRENIHQTPFDAAYTAYLMRNGMANYKTLSSPEYGGVTQEQNREIVNAIPHYAKTHELDEYLVVKNERGANVGQIVGSAVKIKLLQKTQESARLCLRTFPGIPVFRDSFPVADFAYLVGRDSGFRPMGYTSEVNEETGEICVNGVDITDDATPYSITLYKETGYGQCEI